MSNLQDPRVLFAAERTLLAWTRTSLALIAFGFVLERGGILMRALDVGGKSASASTFWIGLAFITLGVFSSVYSSRQYLVVLKTLEEAEFPVGYKARWSPVVNMMMAILGTALAIALFVANVS